MYSLSASYRGHPACFFSPHLRIGVNISERKSGTERPKKRKKREFVFFSPPSGGATATVVHCLHDTVHRFCPIYHNAGYLYPEIFAAWTKSQLNKQAKHITFHNFAVRISFSEHWKLVAEFHLTLERAHMAHFSNSKKSVSLRLKAVVLAPMRFTSLTTVTILCYICIQAFGRSVSELTQFLLLFSSSNLLPRLIV